jgi:hypothetical protein
VPAARYLVRAVERDGRTRFERTNGLQVDRAGHALRQQGCSGRLVDRRAGNDFGRVKVELDTAVVAHAEQFAAVHRRRDEVLAEAADRDCAGATVDALTRDTRQACQ